MTRVFMKKFSHLDAIRTIAFHPTELCLASGSDDNMIKLWRVDVATSGGTRSSRTFSPHSPPLPLQGLPLPPHTAGMAVLMRIRGKGPMSRNAVRRQVASTTRPWCCCTSTVVGLRSVSSLLYPVLVPILVSDGDSPSIPSIRNPNKGTPPPVLLRMDRIRCPDNSLRGRNPTVESG